MDGNIGDLNCFPQAIAERFTRGKRCTRRDDYQLATGKVSQAVLLTDLAGQHSDEALLKLFQNLHAMLFAQGADVVKTHHDGADFTIVACRVRHGLNSLKLNVFTGKEPSFRILNVLLKVFLELILRLREFQQRIDTGQQLGAPRTAVNKIGGTVRLGQFKGRIIVARDHQHRQLREPGQP